MRRGQLHCDSEPENLEPYHSTRKLWVVNQNTTPTVTHIRASRRVSLSGTTSGPVEQHRSALWHRNPLKCAELKTFTGQKVHHLHGLIRGTRIKPCIRPISTASGGSGPCGPNRPALLLGNASIYRTLRDISQGPSRISRLASPWSAAAVRSATTLQVV